MSLIAKRTRGNKQECVLGELDSAEYTEKRLGWKMK